MAGQNPKSWVTWLSLAKWWYNTNFHSTTLSSLYEIVYGQPSSLNYPYLVGESKVEAVDRSLSTREESLKMLKFHLQRAQNRMKQQADKKWVNCVYEVRDWVFVKLQPDRQLSIRGKCTNLVQNSMDPFWWWKIGKVVYKLDIPQYHE
ncbi:uncharacterized protein LOC124917827 [Impatiens glandulifera]|uniref:uncharacterized protein LOC124917827 n=1 Tax=Impatiens glandulifera TaxID=253017 RepID=UPI001FB06900|nr:uncharacterized protein LOC124917827 [Impatiens glandulifera]